MAAFLGLAPPHTDPDRAAFTVVPVPFEATTTYEQGTAAGPAAILAASRHVEFYDEELGVETARAGVYTAPPFSGPSDPEAFVAALAEAYPTWRRPGTVVALLGGEHTLTVGAVRALRASEPELGVLWLDAHADLRDRYAGSPYNHACTLRRVLETGVPVVAAGVRALSAAEAAFLRATNRVRVFFAHEGGVAAWEKALVAALPERVYLSLDVDVLDPAEAPGTGTPEPGGLRYREVLALIRAVAQKRDIVGMDLVEVRPLPGERRTEFLAARLLYKIFGTLLTRGGSRRPRLPHPPLEGPPGETPASPIPGSAPPAPGPRPRTDCGA